MTLPREFYDRPTLDVARDLLGKVLVHRRGGVVTSGAIVEVEAYIGESDPACHAAPGPTPTNTAAAPCCMSSKAAAALVVFPTATGIGMKRVNSASDSGS